jgi:hypothetical protein
MKHKLHLDQMAIYLLRINDSFIFDCRTGSSQGIHTITDPNTAGHSEHILNTYCQHNNKEQETTAINVLKLRILTNSFKVFKTGRDEIHIV